jgi:hypothetical protein
VAIRTRVVPLGGGRFELVAVAANETDRPIDTVIRYACPGTTAQFDGLPGGYDAGGRCRMGACVEGPTAQAPLVLPPEGTQVVARVTIDASGDDCNAPLPSGRYSIGAAASLEGVRACSTSRAILANEATPAPTPVSPTPARPRPARREPPQAPPRERCPAMGCAYTPCPPGVEPPTGCAAICGCPGARGGGIMAPPP